MGKPFTKSPKGKSKIFMSDVWDYTFSDEEMKNV